MNEEHQTTESPGPAGTLGWLDNFKNFYRESLIGIIIGGLTRLALTVFVAIIVYKSFFAPRIVSVDVAGILDEQVRKAVDHPMNDQERQQNAAAFSKALEDGINHVAADGKTIVLVKPAVLRGSIDMTADVQAYINNVMMSMK